MHQNLNKGISGELTTQVTRENTAEAYKSGLIAVFATPAMIALMEYTAQLSVQLYLEEGYTTVGTEVNIKHIKATPVGMQVRAKSELLEVQGNKLKFAVEAHDETGKIGFGTHTRYIIHAATFLQNLQNK